MNFNREKIKNLLYLDRHFNGLFDFFSMQERERFLEVLDSIFYGMELTRNSESDEKKLIGIVKKKILFEIEQLHSYFAPQILLDRFDIDFLLQQLIIDSAATDKVQRLYNDSDINTSINIDDLDRLNLFELTNFESVKYLAFTFIENYDADSALKLSNKLWQLLSKIEVNGQQETYILSIYNFWVLRLSFFSFKRLKKAEKSQFIKEKTIELLKYGFDLKNQLSTYVEIFESVKICNDIKHDFFSSLNSSQEILGSNKQGFDRMDYKPTVENWIREYQTILKPSGAVELKPGTFHIVKFLDTNQYVKLLSSQEQQVLKELLNLYNWLIIPVVNVSQDFETISLQENSVPYMQSQRFELPEVAVSDSNQIGPKPPVVPIPKNAPVVRPMGDVDTGIRAQGLENRVVSSIGMTGLKLPPTLPPVAEIMKQSSNDSGTLQRPGVINGYRPETAKSIHDILQERDSAGGVGLRTSDGNKPVQPEKNKFFIADKNASSLSGTAPLKQKSTSVDALRQAEIDKKLEELEKKIKE